MKRKMFLAVFLSLALLLGLAACKTTLDVTPSPDPTGPTQDFQQEDELLRVIIGNTSIKKPDFTHTNETLREWGFNLAFEPSKGSSFADVEKSARENITKNAVFITMPGWGIETKLKAEGLLGDFYDAGMQYVPSYTEHPHVENCNDPDTLVFMPTRFDKVRPFIPSVLVREDVAAQYGEEIRTASQYIDLLRWLKGRDPESVPGAALALVNSNIYYLPLDLFLPEMGYVNIASQLGCLEIETKRVFPRFSTQESRYALEEYARLQRDGLLYLKNMGRGNGKAFDEFPTVLQYAYDFISYAAYAYEQEGFDASGYRMYTLYDRQLPESNIIGRDYYMPAIAFAGENADVSEFLRLMEWLDDPENYRRLLYGEESADYTRRSGRIEQNSNSGVDWTAIRASLWCLGRSEFNEVPITAPSNYEEELASIDFAYGITLSDEDLADIQAWRDRLSDADETFLYDDAYDELLKFNRALYAAAYVPDEDFAKQVIDEFIEKQSTRDAMFQEYKGILDEAIARAAS